MLQVGDAFPDFSLLNQDAETVTKADIAGAPAVIYFYPKDDTTGCTAEACEFQELAPDFSGEESQGARVVGVSPDSVKSHRKFADKYSLGFTLLADTEQVLANACGVWVEKSMYGKKYMGVERTTFVIDADGIVTAVFNKVKPKGHAKEVLASLK
jgi:peroxiredoxin Q/BCP